MPGDQKLTKTLLARVGNIGNDKAGQDEKYNHSVMTKTGKGYAQRVNRVGMIKTTSNAARNLTASK